MMVQVLFAANASYGKCAIIFKNSTRFVRNDVRTSLTLTCDCTLLISYNMYTKYGAFLATKNYDPFHTVKLDNQRSCLAHHTDVKQNFEHR